MMVKIQNNKASMKYIDFSLLGLFVLLLIGLSLMDILPSSYVIAFVAMVICGRALGLYLPHSFIDVSNFTDPTNSATTTMLIACMAHGGGSFSSMLLH